MNGNRIKRSVFLWLVFLALGALALLAGCSGGPEEPPAKPQVYVLVFDPTVFEPSEGEKLKAWMDRLSGYLEKRVPQRSRVAVFTVGRDMLQATPEVREFEPKVQYGGEKEHRAEVEAYLQGLVGSLEKAWATAHGEEWVKVPSSCILSSLDAVENYLKGFERPNDYEFSLVLLSDMVESCDDGASLISFDRGAAEIDKLKQVETDLSLSQLSRVIVVQLPSRVGRERSENRMIESSWKAFFVGKAGVPEDKLSYLRDFPVE